MATSHGRRQVLVVDDEAPLRELLVGFLEAKGYDARAAGGGAEALALIGQQRPHVVVLDLRLPDMGGLDTLARIKELDERIHVLLVTGYGTVDSAVTAMKLGAADFLAKPLKLAELLRAVECAGQAKGGSDEGAASPRLAPPAAALASGKECGQAPLEDLMGPSAAISRTRDLVAQVAGTSLTVIIYGETGAGKSLVAGAIHGSSPRAARRLVRVDCGAIPDTLIESELFGHERGAFTGAVDRNQGYFELAHQGTLFLDEIANLSEAMMRKLLCALEDRRIYRVGGKEPIDLDIRVIAASNQNLGQLVEKGAFRRDLFHRLNEFVIEIPPLRKRSDDIPFLARRFLAMANAELGRRVQGISPEALDVLQRHEWPGNVRELRNVIKRAVLLARDAIEPSHLRAASASCTRTVLPPADCAALEQVFQGKWSLKDITRECVRQVEQRVITAVLDQTGGNRSKAARLLSVDYKTLYYKAKELGY